MVVRVYRYTQTSQRYPNLIDEAQKSWNPVYTTKWTYNVNQRQKLIGYYQYTNKRQPDYLFGSTTILKSDALPDSYFPVRVMKGEYNASIGVATFGRFAPAHNLGLHHQVEEHGAAHRGQRGQHRSGGVAGGKLTRSRPQINGSLSYFKDGWGGTIPSRSAARS